jgi:hypothetical protein
LVTGHTVASTLMLHTEVNEMTMNALILIAAMTAYFIPAIVAVNCNHNNSGAIFMTNLFLGCSGIGWVFALIWATTDNVKLPKRLNNEN